MAWFKAHFAGKFSWRTWIILGYLAVAVVFAACSAAFIYAPASTQISQRQMENLTLTAQANANVLAYAESAQQFAEAATKDSDLRLTVISKSGLVLADSEVDPDLMENHLQREEVQEALNGEVGQTERNSASDGTERLYVAVPSTYLGEQVVLRLSEPSTAFNTISDSLRNTGILLVAIGFIVIVVVAVVSVRQTSTPFKKLDQVRSDFVANASHELKTPVAGIRLLSEAINDAADLGDMETLKLFMARLDNEADRLQRLVIDLLDLSRLETTPSPDKHPRADLHSTLVTSFFTHKHEAEDKGLEFTLIDNSRTGDNCYASMEPSDASLIFDNLIENAIMYTDEGSIKVTFETRGRDIAVMVEDTGLGIPQADQSRIFERFYRVDKARSREVGGTGLGLSLVRHAVERSNGAIKLRSELGQGTQFTVLIPRSKRN